MHTKKYFLAILLSLPFMLKAQEKKDELIPWDQNRKLTWADYKAKPNLNSDAAASTTTYLGIEYNMSNNSFSYKITCSFSKNRSWGLHQNDHILGHEQGHFDIAEIYARKLNKEMGQYRFNKQSYQQDLKKIYQDILKEKEDMQNDYDDETNHSINKEKQAEWLKKIAKKLEEYKEYADY
ncbi:MAG TPA: DUF922 domain-containing protein [Chitinophagaceae bacterium]